MTDTNIALLSDQVLIRVFPQTDRMERGLYIPDTCKDKSLRHGEVVRIGPGARIEKGERKGKLAPTFARPGDHVLFWARDWAEFEIGFEQYIIVKEEQHIVGIVRDGGLWPTYERVIVRELAPTGRMVGGLFVPDTAKPLNREAEVVSVGPGFRGNTGEMAPLDVEVGDRVLLKDWYHSPVKFNDEDFLVVTEEDIIGVVCSRCKETTKRYDILNNRYIETSKVA